MKKWINKILFFLILPGSAQNKISVKTPDAPKLVVGIVIDQMRDEYLHRFRNRFGNNGFRKLTDNGLVFKDMHYNYVPTFTGPGHASIYSGSTPRFHGIVANEWYIRQEKKEIYCVDDATVISVPLGYKDGKKSPHRLWCTNISDELKFRNKQSKVISVSLKDRSAILPAGHAADGAYWMDDSSGHFITSSFYREQLPGWAQSFNRNFRPEDYLKNGWSTLYSINTYTSSTEDDFPYEKSPFGGKAVFPYDFSKLGYKPKFFKYTPFGNTILRRFAMQAVVHEALGKDAITDFLWISFSAPDYVGHMFGPRSVELEDTYIRLDRELDTLITFLDKQVGQGQYLLFLTADHACSENIGYLKKHKTPGGSLTEKKLEDTLKAFFRKEFNHAEWLEKVSNFLIYLNIPDPGFYRKAIDKTKAYLLSLEGILEVAECSLLDQVCAGNDFPEQLNKAGYASKLEADLIYTPSPGWLDYDINGTTHGVCYAGDTHVPMLWYGHRIKKGRVFGRKYITQIAPTVAQILGIPKPSCALWEPLGEILKNYE
ncbi:MAG: alkaline phosphatase family protein [Bacteroidia bacterium]|nr:alkaline phosphatase family protein [Bacteroidia bacterium]